MTKAAANGRLIYLGVVDRGLIYAVPVASAGKWRIVIAAGARHVTLIDVVQHHELPILWAEPSHGQPFTAGA